MKLFSNTLFSKKAFMGFLLFFPVLSFAAAPSWKIIPEASTLNFTAMQNGGPVKGMFKKFTADIQGDPADLKDCHVKIIVDLTSVMTDYGMVQSTLTTAPWFDTANHPTAIFIADKFTQTGKKSYTADGSLTLRGKSEPAVLKFVLVEYSGKTFVAKGSTTVQRTLFGVGSGEWAKTDSIKDNVQVDFTLKASKA